MTTPHAIVFPGQGSQRVGMLDRLPENESFDRLLDAAEALSGQPLRRHATQGPESDLGDTRSTQPLLYLTDWAWGTALIEAGLEPAAVAGHSLGEFAALAIAGVFSVEAGLELVCERSRLMAVATAEVAGTMSAVLGLTGQELSDLIEPISGVWVANDNTPGQVVISGTHQGVEKATEALAAAGARRVVPLAVSGPFHSPLMQPAADAFAEILDRAHFNDAEIPVIQNAEPAPTTDASVIVDRLQKQIVSPVRWTETMRAFVDMDVSILVEAGPGAVLKGLARRFDGLEAVAVEDGGIEAILEGVQ